MKNPYEILGLEKTATFDEIKLAYRKLVKQHHPDVNNGSCESHEKMIDINAAYEFLQERKSERETRENKSTKTTQNSKTNDNQESWTTDSEYKKEYWEAFWAKHKAYAKAEYESMGKRMKEKVARNLEPIRQENLKFSNLIMTAKNYDELHIVAEYYSAKFEDMIKTMYDYVQKRHRYGMPPNYVFGKEKDEREKRNKKNLESLGNIKFLNVNSSYISSVFYDKQSLRLYINFKDGSLFAYFNVACESYDSLIKSRSIGSYFIKNIKNCYGYEQLIIPC